MTGIITGDIIGSRLVDSKTWLPVLKEALKKHGTSPKAWEVYRGDSFQLEIKPNDAFWAALYIKASIKQIASIDARMGIGIGATDYPAKKITESNGEAFVNSGNAFKLLNSKRTLALITPSTDINKQMELAIDLALLTMNTWPVNAAKYIKSSLEHPDWKQTQLAQHLGKTQGTISQSLNRAGFDDILRLDKRYRELITNL